MARACPFDLPETTVSVKGHTLVVEWADTQRTRACGLSLRTTLKQNSGMLFVYDQKQYLTFWMKHTSLALSIAFLDESGTILNIDQMTPNQTTVRYRSRKPAAYALEVNRGWFRSRGIESGDRVEIQSRGPVRASGSPSSR